MQHLDQTNHLLVAQLTRYEVYFYFTHFHCAKFSNFIIPIHLINKIHQTRNSSLFLFILNVFQLRHHKIAQRTNRKLKSTILSKKKNTTSHKKHSDNSNQAKERNKKHDQDLDRTRKANKSKTSYSDEIGREKEKLLKPLSTR